VALEPAGFEMILVEAGSFQMGSDSGQANERPAHAVQLTRSFFIARLEATWDEYDRFCSETSRRIRTDKEMGRGDRPAIVNWYDATEYCNWLSEQAGLNPCYDLARLATTCDFEANGYRLPTEAEWEYAARGGPRSQGYACAGNDDPDQVAWHAGNSNGVTQPVGQLQPNELGLFDMNGNLWEWSWDWYQRDYYSESASTDPLGPALASTAYSDVRKVLRGGHWVLTAEEISVTIRSFDGPDYEEDGSAIRLVRTT
jgi:formylglycine-generating enzyme required for sulfatase activity